jgi:ABC-type sugar transport system ATPase subunit
VLDVALQNVTVPSRLHEVTLAFARSTHTAIIGPPASGASTLLQVISGHLRPAQGKVLMGTRDVTSLRRERRPLLVAAAAIDAPARWSVRHLLVAAVRQRTLDREDRHREFELAVSKWNLGAILDRSLRSLSSSERTSAQVGRIELLRPAVLIADRVLESMPAIADDFYRMLRVIGTTVISSPASRDELGFADRVFVLDGGRVVQQGSPHHVYLHPANEAAAAATGPINIVPIVIRGNGVESAIGAWNLLSAPFQGSGVALARPEEFEIVPAGEESDLIFGIEEANFRDGRWHARGILSGNFTLHVALPGDAPVHKGRLIPLRFDPARFTLLQRDRPPVTTVPTDVVPPLRETR